MWVNDTTEYEDAKMGDFLFLCDVFNTSNAVNKKKVCRFVLHTNGSHEPRLYGWCGETNNRSVTAQGVVQVTFVVSRLAQYKRNRLLVKQLRGKALATALESMGRSDLIP